MNLDQYISELLFEHDCVIIPGFGGIVTSYRSSFLNPARHTFSPPSKKLAFNASLRNNDGLLANHLCNSLSINYQEANNHINKFVESCMATLKDGRKLSIEKIGQLYLDDEHNLQFVPDVNVNYLKSSFGLYTIHSPAVRRSVESPFEGADFMPIHKKKAKSGITRFAWRFIEVIPAAAVLVLLVLNPTIIQKLNQQAASINPFGKQPKSELAVTENSKLSADEKKKVTEKNKPNEFDLPTPTEGNDQKKTAFDLAGNNTTTTPVRKPVPPIIFKSEPTLATAKPAEAMAKKDIPVATIEKKVTPVVINKPATDDKKESMSSVVSTTKQNSRLYYIIGGCFGVFENATNFRDQMIAEGFQAAIIGQNANGLHMVSLFSSPDNQSAVKELALIKEKAQTSAWLFRK